MNSAVYVDNLIGELKGQVTNGGIPLSDACWDLCLACVGWPYVYSAWGALCTPSERRKRFKMCPTHETIKTKCKAFDNGDCSGCAWYMNGEQTRCTDCRGFTDWILKMLCGFDLYGDTVSAQWNHKDNWCIKGTIGVDPIPRNVLVNVFVKKNGSWTHTGFWFNGATCESSSNVQYFAKASSKWTHWAVAKCFENVSNGNGGDENVSTPVETKCPTLKKGSKGDWVTLLQTKLLTRGYSLPKYGADGDFGAETEKAVKQFQKDNGLNADGIVGEKTWGILNGTVEPVSYYTVTVQHTTKAVADEIVKKYGGTITEE